MLKPLAGLVTLLLLSGCANLGYYAQAIEGHFQLMHSTRPIDEILHDPGTEPGLREKLEKASTIREFASQELALPDNRSYRSYADLGRPYVVWNVFAAKEFSVKPEEWCLLFVGCINYRGYYSRAAAERFARNLRQHGLETYVGSVPAYSTLGYFNDPVLNTFLRLGDEETARIIFHELAHQVVFIADDSTFNESFATTVENEGMRRWLAHYGNAGQQRELDLWQQRKSQFLKLITDYRDRLDALYARPLPATEKRHAKAELLNDLKQAYWQMRADWGNARNYDAFFEEELNNAKLGSVSLYTALVPNFQALLAATGYDLPAFYREVAALARLSKEDRSAALERISTTNRQ